MSAAGISTGRLVRLAETARAPVGFTFDGDRKSVV